LKIKRAFQVSFFFCPAFSQRALCLIGGISVRNRAGTAFAYFTISPAAPFPGYAAAYVLFALSGAVLGLVAEALRTEMEKFVQAKKTKALLLMELAHRTKNNLARLSAMMRLQAKAPV
jgi:hypothetical protein